LGATLKGKGVNFSIFSRNAEKVFLLLFSDARDAKPYKEIEFNPEIHKTGDIWHLHIEGLKTGQAYLYRMDGEYNPKKGHRFNPNVYLLDPYAKSLSCNFRWDLREAGAFNDINDKLKSAEKMPKSIVIDDDFDWENDKPLNIPLKDTIIYETHIRGLTVHHSSKVENPGTYRGVIEKIPYFKELGITALEFLPVAQFDQLENYRHHPETGKLLKNYWGYSTMLFFAPNGYYSYPLAGKEDVEHLALTQQVADFKQMVKELHKHGIEVILDVVFNHTAEGNESGPTISFKGIDNSIYYILENDNSGDYKNYSGCGNTLNCNHPVVRRLILDSLHYWVNEMHVDGFRFDLASILGRDQEGEIMENAPLLESIAEDPLLRDIKIIAEAWDAGGAYQVGGFRNRWGEWNGKYRDEIRKYWNTDNHIISDLATRFAGSSDLYHITDRTPLHSINFITSHDGFTLNDLVSYNKKHNEENGENNKDGDEHNFSNNYGVEGDTDDKDIEFIRKKQIKNFMTTLFTSQGVPMLLGGDEFRRTQQGNNNAYCQDNEISWYDWSFTNKHKEILEFTKAIISLRKQHPVFTRFDFFCGKCERADLIPDIIWYDIKAKVQSWSTKDECLAVFISGKQYNIHSEKDDNDAYIIFNPTKKDIKALIPDAPEGKRWFLCIDTYQPYNMDIKLNPYNDSIEVKDHYTVKERSIVLLLSY
ncbi:MAG: glycogen debranching protein GlgX, partial [Spirochaetota bacterium]